MNIISSNNSKNVVSLQELVPQHDCLKLLILHTPYTLVIDTLPLCINLVKLDLSKNNLESFPYLGDLSSLKFMFIHENKLDSNQLRSIFEKNGKKSSLSLNIVWVTFWGNKNSFLGRHYLVNETSVIAVDKNMVVQEQRTSQLPSSNFEAFSHETDISEYLLKKNTINRHASEEEYMRQLWIEMSQLRKRHQKLFPIIKIQKWFRGWSVREKKYQADQKLRQHSSVKSLFFAEWKQYVQKRIKLKYILAKSKKEYLLLQTKQMNKKQIQYRLVEIARNIKKKVISRKISLSSQMKFYNIVRQNYLLLKNIYQSLEVDKSSAIYIYKHSWSLFQKYIMPFLHLFEWQNISIKSNQNFSLHILHEFYSQKSKEFIKILQTNTKSTVFYLSNSNIDIKKMRRGKKALLYGSNLKSIYTGVPHFPTKRLLEIKGHMENISAKDNYALQELIKIEGQSMLLKDITRGIYFFNTKRLNLTQDLDKRIHFFSERMLKKITYAVKIQKVWRGYSFRKKNEQHLKIILKLQRAVIIIQRWARKISANQKKIFMFYVAQRLNEIQENVFYVEMTDYMKQLEEKKEKRIGCAFLEQNVQLFLDQQNHNLVLSWDNKSQNYQVLTNILNNVPLFTKHFLNDKIGLSEELINLKFVKNITLQKRCEFSHLFHYDAQSNIISRLGKKYLQVKCQSKLEAKFRTFALMLMTYSIKNKIGLKIYTSKLFSNIDQANKIQIGKKDAHFICNQNFNLIKSCELRFQKEVSVTLYVISNKFYLQNKDEKPIKAEEKFFIYLSNEVEIIPKKDIKRESGGTEERRRYKTDVSYTSGGPFGQQNFLTEVMNDTESNASQHNMQQERLKQLMKKRSVKQFKIEKKAKNKKPQHPSFILDSISINDRLTTQPDYNIPNLSNRENNSVDHNSDALHAESSLSKPKITYAQRKGTSIKKKQQEGFTKRFVNLANFIQNQYAHDYRRRIKTEIQNNAVQSADNIRRSMERSHSHRNHELQEKHKKIRQRHSQHKEIIEKVQVLTRQRSLQMKNDVLEEREKKMKERAKLKRLKVSFAEECYPLASKTRKTEHFP